MQTSQSAERLYDVLLVDNRPRLDLALYTAGNTLVIEGEVAVAGATIPAEFISRLRRLMAFRSAPMLHRLAVREVQKLTGYDRVSVWRFHGDGHFEKLAETSISRRPSVVDAPITNQDSVFHRRSQAWLKMVADSRAPLVPVLELSSTDGLLMLACGLIASPTPHRLQDLLLRGITAYLSMAIRVEDKLWGVLECEHPIPHRPSASLREALEVFASVYSLALEKILVSPTVAFSPTNGSSIVVRDSQ